MSISETEMTGAIVTNYQRVYMVIKIQQYIYMIIYDYVTDYIYIWSLKNMDDYSGYGLTYGSTK